MKILIKERKDSYENAKICYICKEKFENKYLRVKKNCKTRDRYHYQENIEVLRRAYVI